MNPCIQNISCFCKPRKRFEFLAKDIIFETNAWILSLHIVPSNDSSKFEPFLNHKKVGTSLLKFKSVGTGSQTVGRLVDFLRGGTNFFLDKKIHQI